VKQPLAGIRTKLFFSFLLIISISYSSLLFITIKSIDTSLEKKADPVQAQDRPFSREYKLRGTHHAFPSFYISREELASIREKTLEHIMMSAALGIFLSFAIAYLLARKLTGPARQLSHGAERIEVGDFTHRVKVAASDEFGSLAASFNKMAEALEERELTIKRKTLDLEILNRSLHELNEKLENKVAERTADLETGKGRLEAILTSMAEGVLVTDQENRIILFNPSAQKIFDLSLHRALGQHIDQVCSLGGFCQLLDFIREIQNGDYLSEGREEHLEIKGKKLKINMSPLLDKTWEFAGVVMSIRDVTLEEEIDRMKTDFISTVSHELKTPLTSIKGSLQLILRRSSELLDTERELLVVCQRNTDRLIRLISDILDISRIESGSIDFNFKPESVGRVVSEAIEEMTGFASERDITLHDTTGCDLPPVFADRDRLLQVMTNLLSNAVKFSPEGQTVTVEAERNGDYVAVAIIDNGPVIRKTERNKLFRKFQRLGGNESGERGGTGLGLAICKEIIDKHHGRIYYKSRMGGGNIFTFTVPLYGKIYEQ
jgi:two-component system sensor histidine kinase VicK